MGVGSMVLIIWELYRLRFVLPQSGVHRASFFNQRAVRR